MEGLANSLYVLAAFDGEHLVGLLRAVGDGVTITFIQDTLVLPDCQRRGIEKTLLEMTLAAFKNCY